MSEVADINDLDLMNEPVEVDGSVTGEEFFLPALPDDGAHTVLLSLSDKGVKVAQQSPAKGGKLYIVANLAGDLIDDAGNKIGKIFDNPNSIVFGTPAFSRLHALLDITGNAVPSRSTPAEIKEAAEAAFATPQRAGVVTQWEASAKAETEDEVNAAVGAKYFKSGAKVGDYYTFLKGQKKFPLNAETGRHEQEVTNPITGEKVRAQVRVVRYRKA